MNQRAPWQAVLSSFWMTWWGATFIHTPSSWTVNRKAEMKQCQAHILFSVKKPRSKVLLGWQSCKTASLLCIHLFFMCVDFVSLSVKDQRARFLFCEEFWWHSTQSRQIQQIFYQLFYFHVFYNGDSFNRFTSGKRIFSKVQHFYNFLPD